MSTFILNLNQFLHLFIEKPQRIEPKNFNIQPIVPGFGYSISKDKVDVDNNDCKDFAVGYPKSNRVVLLRSKEVVTLSILKLDVDDKTIDPPPAVEGKF